MSKIEEFTSILFGFFIFEILFIRIGFLFGIPIGFYTLPISYIVYLFCIFSIYLFLPLKINFFIKNVPLLAFIFCTIFLYVSSIFLAKTYDTSWDGQGYHQSAVIALANKWNPIYQPAIPFSQKLPSQIFAEGYPSALWEIEGSIYAFFGKINAAKVVNLAIAIVAFMLLYSVLRKIHVNWFLSAFLSICIVLQPVYIMQLLTFMEDGFSYQLLLIAVSSLLLFTLSHKSHWAIAVFFLSEYFLVTTKYSDLPVAFILGVFACAIILNRFLSKEYLFSLSTKLLIGGLIISGIIFAYLPYGRNILFHRALFYPTNIPALMGSVTFNNVPNNLQNSDKLKLLFYGVFSRAQSAESGSPTSKSNVAVLKIPFTFSYDELIGSAQLFNNRVGGGGPLFSGAIVLAIMLLLISYFLADEKKERYAIYTIIFLFSCTIGFSLIAPTPNLMRYVNQLQLLPFIIVIPLYAVFKNPLVKSVCAVLFIILFLNVSFFSYAVITKTISDTRKLDQQYATLKNSGNVYDVRTQQFYSSYIILQEKNVPFRAVASLPCGNSKSLYASSTTTQYCIE